MIIEIPDDNSIIKWKKNDKEDWKSAEISDLIEAFEQKSQAKCKTCRHRDPEDRKCDCGGQERIGCIFPVRDSYFCKFYEKRGTK